MSQKDEESINKISKMLEIGGTMLAQHCEVCGAPLFRYKGNVMCPVCDSSPSIQEKQVLSTSPEVLEQRTSLQKHIQVGDFSHLEQSLTKKLNMLGSLIQKEEDSRKLKELLELIEQCLNILYRLKNNK